MTLPNVNTLLWLLRTYTLIAVISMVAGCVNTTTSTATDRLKAPAAAHAGALAGDDLPAIRSTGRALLASLAALGDW